MVLGLSVAEFTVLHVVISMIAIFAGFIVVGGLFANAGLAAWTMFFLAMTILTNITGFMFPFGGFTPAIAVGILSTLLLLAALVALYGFRLRGRWRLVYVTTAVLALYFNVFVMIVQSFQKVSFLKPLAPNGSEPPFAIAQAVNVVGFVLLGWMAARAFQPKPKIVA
jgi:hypothetical protein